MHGALLQGPTTDCWITECRDDQGENVISSIEKSGSHKMKSAELEKMALK